MHVVGMKVNAWEISPKDRIGRKDMQFLVLVIGVERGPGDSESIPGKGRCFCALFGKECEKCVNVV